MSKFYKLDIIVTLLKKGLYIKALRILFLVIFSKISTGRRLVYLKKSETLNEDLAHLDFQLLCFISVEDCKACLGNILNNEQALKIPLDQSVVRGKRTWVGIKDNMIIFVACTTQGEVARYFFELENDMVIISHCKTHPKLRGLGIYSHGLNKIMLKMANDGVHSFYIDCFEDNWSSSRGIEKAGFTLIGYGWDKKGKLTYKPLQCCN